jgi:hypothetical protein
MQFHRRRRVRYPAVCRLMIANPDCANEVRANGSFHPFPAGWSKQSIMPSAGDGSVGR